MAHERPVSHTQRFYSDAEADDRVSQLKFLFARAQKPGERPLYLEEILRVRSLQLQAHIAAGVP